MTKAIAYFLQTPIISKIRQGQFIIAIIIFATLILMPNPASIGINQQDYILHFIGNVLLILSAWLACLGRFKPIIPLIFAIPYSVALELSQILTDSRTLEFSDLIANVAGLVTGYLIAVVLNTLLAPKSIE